ncbi:transcriptional regulator [Arthrobacter sp. EpRS66]|nr:transcriptional regulator [Arthrobacter sp. EpRS66]
MTTHYLTLSGIATRIGISPTTAKKYADDGRLPEPDAVTGDGPKSVRGWLPETIDAWNASRPGHGGRPKKDPQD